MRAIIGKTLFVLTVCSTTVYAASGGDTESMSTLTLLFLGFLALIIAIQFIPGVVLFYSMLRGLFSKVTAARAPAENDDSKHLA